MHIESAAFIHNHPIPAKYAYEGENICPPLAFGDIPSNAKSLALIVDDPDAPHGTFDHWIVWNLSPKTTSLESAAQEKQLSKQGKNHYGNVSYDGPNPPPGTPHRYFFKLYALDTLLNIQEGASKKQLEEAMEGHIIARAELIGTYQR